MSRTLTKKQKGFIADYLKTGNGTHSVLKNYNIKGKTKEIRESTAGSMATENLGKPKIQKALADRLPDDLLEERHLELLNKREVIVIEKDEDGEKIYKKLDQPETQAVTKGLDMAYKLKGSYAPEKSIQIQAKVPFNPVLDEIRKEYEEKLRASLIE